MIKNILSKISLNIIILTIIVINNAFLYSKDIILEKNKENDNISNKDKVAINDILKEEFFFTKSYKDNEIKRFFDWFFIRNDKLSICYIISTPIYNNYNQNYMPYIMIINKMNDNLYIGNNYIKISNSIFYNQKNKIELLFDNNKLYDNFNVTLRTYNNFIIFDRETTKIRFTRLMKNSNILNVISNYNSLVIEHKYSLIGFNAAYNYMKDICIFN